MIPSEQRRAPRRQDWEFHKNNPEYAENSIVRALNNGYISKEDSALIRSFIAELKAENGISTRISFLR